ncbi:unnamed protein product [Rotaria sordida]|uniref:Helix-turn-helix domain-containing protein n=1 Tax=Rotaria sordida TaxID=392033 RepID=A0A815WFS5_9BILA|nr:unnamed protein product [Rotaria sordida]CAF1545355.1 unnamed protein product [Rotaria sordida]
MVDGRITLQANAFVYGKKFYRQIIGSAMGSAFTLTLANIFIITKSIPFLDVLISNISGILFSSVYHKPATEPSLLSFLSDHPRHVIQTILMRAVRYSSTFQAFNNERRTIRLTLLLNGFFKYTDYEDIRLIVGHRNNPNLEFELARKRPHSSLFTNIPFNKKQKLNDSAPTT